MSVALRKGRQTKERVIHEIRSLTREDLLRLKEKRDIPKVQRFRDTHHRLARLCAAGLRTDEVAERSGYSRSRVLMFSSDPAFMELVAHYRQTVTEGFKEGVDEYFELATGNMVMAERQIREKLEEADEEGQLLPTRELIAISRDAADRFGYGKRQTNVNVNVDFAAKLEQAIARSGKTIEAKPVGPSGSSAPGDVRPTPAAALPAPTQPPRKTQAQPVAGPLFRRKLG